jgi:hypothetical protein
VPASARRPASVIVSRSMLSVRPPAFTISGLATASPARTILVSSLTVHPCARNVPSVHPCGLPARISSARRCSKGLLSVTRGGLSRPVEAYVADLQLIHWGRPDAVFLILTKLSFPVQSLVALPSHFPDGGARTN